MKKKSMLAVLICAAVMLVCSSCGLFSGLNNEKEYETTLAMAYTSIAKCDAEMYYKVLPPCYKDYFNKYNLALIQAGYGNIYDVLEEQLQKTYGDKYGTMQISHRVISDTDLSDSEIKKIEDDLNDFASETVDIEEGCNSYVELDIKGSKKSEKINTQMTLIKIDGKWYCYVPLTR